MTPSSKLVAFKRNNHLGYGLVSGNSVIDLTSRHGGKWPSLREVIEAGMLSQLVAENSHHASDFLLEDIQFEIPIPKITGEASYLDLLGLYVSYIDCFYPLLREGHYDVAKAAASKFRYAGRPVFD